MKSTYYKAYTFNSYYSYAASYIYNQRMKMFFEVHQKKTYSLMFNKLLRDRSI